MGIYLVTTEAVDDGTWYDDPWGFDSEAEAKEKEANQPPPPKGYARVLYRCDQLATLRLTD